MTKAGASSRVVAVALALGFLGVVAYGVAAKAGGDEQPARVVGTGQIRFNGAGPERWAQRYRRARARESELRELVGTLRRRLHVGRLAIFRRMVAQPRMAIRLVFGPYAEQALAVSYCETGGTYSTTATNGQYLGLFQMGSSERATYGHGPTPLEQARAAFAYFAASGFDWSPWECKP